MRSFKSFISRVACLSLGVTVSTTCTTATDPTPIATISLQPQLDSIEVGETYSRWVVTLKDAAGVTLTGRALHWESNNPTIATIDPVSGEVTGVGGGSDVLITVSAEGKEALAVMKVLFPILSIVVTPDSFDLPLTTTRTIVPQLVGPGGVALTNRAITWLSENPAIAVVSTGGVVTPVSLGTTTIVVRAGTKQKTLRVRVVGEPVTTVRVTPQQSVLVLRLGQSRQFSAECLNASQQVLTGRPITWNSANPVVASVSGNGLVTGNSVGFADITATCDNTVSPPVRVQVTLVPVASVSISPSSLSLGVGTQGQLIATAIDSANNVLSLQGRPVVWSSNNIPVAQVSTQGVVFAASIGTAQVTVTVDNTVSAPVTVDVHAFFSLLDAFTKARPTPPWHDAAFGSGRRRALPVESPDR